VGLELCYQVRSSDLLVFYHFDVSENQSFSKNCSCLWRSISQQNTILLREQKHDKLGFVLRLKAALSLKAMKFGFFSRRRNYPLEITKCF
jgi:hypothetical protein